MYFSFFYRTVSNVAPVATEIPQNITSSPESVNQNIYEENTESNLITAPYTSQNESLAKSEAQMDFSAIDTAENHMSPIRDIEQDAHNTSTPSVINIKKKSFKRTRVDMLMDIQKGRTERAELLREIANRSTVSTGPPVVQTDDHIDLFFNSLKATARTLSPLLLVEAKRKLFNVMSEIEQKNALEKYTLVTLVSHLQLVHRLLLLMHTLLLTRQIRYSILLTHRMRTIITLY